jgi:DNA-binding CsgD family transcriptional regulator
MPDSPDLPLYEPLGRREREILALLAENLTDREVAERLYLAEPTVKWYNRQISRILESKPTSRR